MQSLAYLWSNVLAAGSASFPLGTLLAALCLAATDPWSKATLMRSIGSSGGRQLYEQDRGQEITWVSHECHMGITCVSLVCHMGVTWVPHECPMGVTWVPHVSHGCHMTVTWVSHECHMGVTQVSHNCHIRHIQCQHRTTQKRHVYSAVLLSVKGSQVC